jgi:para-nitrobenzyl esterase
MLLVRYTMISSHNARIFLGYSASGAQCMTHSVSRLKWAALLGLTLFAATCAAAGPRPTVDLDGAIWEGAYFSAEPGHAVFKGLPYAEPPIGPLRWRPPQERRPEAGQHNARAYRAACVQTQRLVHWENRILEKLGRGSNRVEAFENVSEAWHGEDANRVGELYNVGEDCLYLNVWTPAHKTDANLPVMVWIHGGSNRSGWSHQHYYDGAALASKGAVVITVNYRLGVFGFFAHPALSAESNKGVSGNYAILDLIAALKWVRKNATAFGGSPDNVTIFGESAGGSNVATLLASPLARGLFQRAVVQSTSFADARSVIEDEELGSKIASALGISADVAPANALADLRALGPGEILQASNNVRAGAYYGPSVDGWVLPQQQLDIYAGGAANNVPVMIGVNRHETSLFIPGPISEERLALTLQSMVTEDTAREKVMSLLDGEPDVFKRLVRLTTAGWMLCSSKQAATELSRHQTDTYFYYFTRARPDAVRWLGAHHAAEIPYLFGTGRDVLPWHAEDLELSINMADYWVQFARSGDPNGGDRTNWPKTTPLDDAYMDFGDTVEARSDLERELCSVLSP